MRIPKYRRNPDGRAFVEHKSIPTKSRRLYLGKYESAESKRKYEQFIARLIATSGEDAHPTLAAQDQTVLELCDLYLAHAEKYYSRHGEPTKEFKNVIHALQAILALHASTLGRKFGPRALREVQSHLAGKYKRGVVNSRIHRIRRFFRWCESQEYLPAGHTASLETVESIRAGRDGVRESEPVEPVPWEDVQATLPFVSPPVAAAIQVQYLCGMRPTETLIMRRCDLDMSEDIWIYEPESHKGTWRKRRLLKAIPPKAQEIIKPLFKPDIDSYLFSPRDAMEWHHSNRVNPPRKTPVYPCEKKRREKQRAKTRRKKKSTYNNHYTASTYRQAVCHGFTKAEKAGVAIPYWHPHQLRHTIATEIRQKFGQQAAQLWLGHEKLDSTSIYAEKQRIELIALARAIGQ